MTEPTSSGARTRVAPPSDPETSADDAYSGAVTDWLVDHPVVLVIDDDPTSRDVVTAMLSRDGLHVVTAADAQGALAAAQEHDLAAVILDVVMPDVDGHELCRLLRQGPLGRDIPVIMLTGKDSLDSELDSVLCGADAYLTKPASREALLTRLQDLL